ncbi:vWA domain-containing protein [Planctomicrobium sp. SH661]|uniref:vWA domain-containing protein n=1 Tax=Planctomicrobium sp. SH661 TaxID=3448124 RepID=UPI003F5C0F95
MTKRTWLSVREWFPVAVAGVALAGAGWGGSYSLAGDVIVRTYETPEGRQIGSASLPLNVEAGKRQNVNHVILLDTSASQIGEHRQMATAVLANFLRSLPSEDRVNVLAYDVQVAPLTSDWTAPGVAEVEVSKNLQDRFPAGSSNLSSALLAARDLLQSSASGSVLVIGDGMSTAHLFQPEELKGLTASFRDREIPIHSFALGSKTDVRLLGILGEETGGYVMQDEWSKSSLPAEKVGKLLADATHQQVFYPSQISVSNNQVELSPSRALPMRADRETVYLLSGPIDGKTEISVTGQLNGQKTDLTYSVPEVSRNNGNTFLNQYWADAKATDGVAIGMAGDWMVNLAHQTFEDQITLISAEGQKALEAGSLQQAEQIGTFLQKVDPHNTRGDQLVNKARAGSMLVAQLPDIGGAPGSDPDDQVPSIPAPGTAVPPHLIERELPVPSDNITNYEALVQAKGQKLEREVQVQVDRAYNLVENSLGAQAEEVLNRTRATIKSATDVPPDLANNLLRRVNSILQDVKSRRAMYDARTQELQRRQAELEVTTRLIDFAAERDLQLQQMVDRIRALMVDAFRGNPDAFEQAETQARVVLSDYPGSAIGSATVTLTEAAGQVDKAARLRALRADRLLETLYQVELSHVPFPDEPPIVYPPAEVWWALTKMRQKWKSVDLKINSKNEEKIYTALDQITSVEFPSTPLKDAIQYLSEQHGIPIRLDMKALEDESLTGEEEISLVLSGIKLKSALKLMLENVGGVSLTYIIEDEIMKITSQAAADEKMQTRVYPVADLVIPVAPLGGGGMGMMGGMGGGMMGGMGGGMGGMGGGMGGMGGMGMGGMGGFMQVPAANADVQPAAQVDLLKKKPAL